MLQRDLQSVMTRYLTEEEAKAGKYAPTSATDPANKVGAKPVYTVPCTDFEEVRAEINRQTDEVAGENKGIVNDPIILTIYATDAPDLSLVDLPGIIHNGPGAHETRALIAKYVAAPTTLVTLVRRHGFEPPS